MKQSVRKYKIDIMITTDWSYRQLNETITLQAKDAVDACNLAKDYMERNIGFKSHQYYILSVTPADSSCDKFVLKN